MTPAFIFIALLVTVSLAIVAVSLIQYGRVRNWRDWIPAIVAVSVIAAILSVTARAQSLSYTRVFFGLEYPNSEGHPACTQNDSQLTSNIGIDQNLYRLQQGPATLAIDGTYRHHSCAIGDDDRVTDTLGVNAVFTVEWR